MENAPSVSASELIGGNPPPKKQRPPLPPGVSVKPVHPGATYGIHPVDKLGIKLTDAKLLETHLPAGSTPPAPPAQPPTPAPAPPITPDPSKPQETQAAPEPEKKPEPEISGPAPDFSDLPKSDNEPAPGGNQQQEKAQPTEAELLTAYERMGAMFWDSLIRLMCALFGDFWAPSNADERKMVIDAFTGWMKSVAFAAFPPIQNLWMAIGLYAMPRMPKTLTAIVSWWKSRKGKRRESEPQRQERREEPDIEVESQTEPIFRAPIV